MPNSQIRPTVEEIFQLLKKTSLPTILVEGKDDIVFYRKIEEDLSHLNADVLPAGNKNAVLELMRRLEDEKVPISIAFVVDKDLWVHEISDEMNGRNELVTTDGYSVENDLFTDGELEYLLSSNEVREFREEVGKFAEWYALAVSRALKGEGNAFRTHPGRVLDDPDFFTQELQLKEGETYPLELYELIKNEYKRMLRGKSLIAILHRQLCKSGRDVKFSGKQLMAFGGSRRGEKFGRIKSLVEEILS